MFERLAATHADTARHYDCYSGPPLILLRRVAAKKVEAARRWMLKRLAAMSVEAARR